MGRETLGQQLTRTLSEGTRIDTTTRTEHTEWVETETITGNIGSFAGDKGEGAEKARKYTDEPGELSFQTDSSKLHCGSTGAIVAWRDREWKTQKIYLVTNKGIFDVELYVISEALDIVLRESQKGHKTSRVKGNHPGKRLISEQTLQ